MSATEARASSAVVLVRRSGAVATVLMDQPGNLNSFTPELREQLTVALQDAAGDSSVRAIVLGGSGRFFSAGANLKQGGAGAQSIREILLKEYKPVFDAVLKAPQPVVAAVPVLGPVKVTAAFPEARFAQATPVGSVAGHAVV